MSDERSETRRRLGLVRILTLADALLLIALLVASFTETRDLVSVLGPVHGLTFLALLYQCARGAGEGLWGWWFPLVVVVTFGPPGSFIGERRIRRALPGVPESSA